MKYEDQVVLNKKISDLSTQDAECRNIYLKKIGTGELQGPLTGYASKDKPWYSFYSDEAINEKMPEMTAYNYLYEQNKDHLDDIAINYYGKKINYKTLFKEIDKTARALVSYGVKKGDTVSIASVTTPEVIYLFYALNKLGAVANMVDPRTNEDRLIEIFNKTNSKLIFSINLLNPRIEKIKDKLKANTFVTISAYDSLIFPLNVIKNSSKELPKIDTSKYYKWSRFINNGRKINEVKSVEYEKNYPAAIVYTGGTTGVSKGAILSNDNFNSMAFHYATANLGIERQQVMLDIMPPFIAYGLNNGIHLPLSVGITCTIIPKFDPEKFPDLIIKYKPNEVLGVPSHFDMLTKSKKLDGVDLSFIVYPAVGGDSMNIVLEEKLNQFLKEHNCAAKITKGFGMTELGGAAITSSTIVNKVGSVGIPFPTNIVGIFKPGTDEELQYNEIGEICITGPTMMKGYLDNEEEEKKVRMLHSDGRVWTHSQDYGYIDKEGFLYVKGRIKRTIVRPDGHNNYPLEIENVINSFKGVEESAVVDMAANRFGNGHIPVAFVVLEDGVDKDTIKPELTKYCSKQLPFRDVACNFIFIDKLPVTNIGKVDYKKLKEELEKLLENNKNLEEETYNNYNKSLVLK
ncbi:MAG: acyl--CoA ligase [Bacilli bacterium]|nr:acyl--CoA ligase [Bacilli bacterium]